MSALRLLAAAACAVIFSSTAPWNPMAHSAQNDEEILSKIRAKAELMYAKYSGVESKRDTMVKQYDSKSGELLSTYRILVVRKEYFLKRPEYRTLKYFKDGKELPPDEYDYRTRDPVYPLFGDESDKNYSVKLNGIVTIAGKTCHEILILPKKKTPRHLSGKAYCDTGTLELYCLEGTVARFPIGVRNIHMQLFFKTVGDASVISHGTIEFEVHVPIFYPNKKFVNTFTSSEEKLIPK